MTNTLIHHMMNTGQSRLCRRADADAADLKYARRLLAEGRHAIPGHHGYAADVVPVVSDHGRLVRVYGIDTAGRPTRPCVLFGMAVGDRAADEVWRDLEAERDHLSNFRRVPLDRTPQPSQKQPWLASLYQFATPDEFRWLDKWQPAVAWAFYEQHAPPPAVAAEESTPPADDSPPPVVARLVEYVRGTGLRGSEVAARCGVPQSMVSKLLSGNLNGITLVNAHKLLTGLGVAKADLVRILAPDGDNSKKE